MNTIIISFTLAVAVLAQPPMTSDHREAPRAELPMPPTYHGRAPVYVPPVTDVYDEIVTNTRILVVEETVWSNTVHKTVWYKKGEPMPRTNFLVLSSNMVQRTTNSLPQ